MVRGMKVLVVGGTLLLAGCGGSLPSEPRPPALAIARLSYADDGTLLAASRGRIVRLDSALNEIDRTVPPFPFDPEVARPGLMYIGISRDGRVATLAWQNDKNPPETPTLTAGGIVFGVPSGELLRLDDYSEAPSEFAGLFLSPDGLTTAAVDARQVQVVDVAGTFRWQSPKAWFSPRFTSDSAALLVATRTELELVSASDGAHLTTIVPPSNPYGLLEIAFSADGTTAAVHAVSDEGLGTITTWRVSDGALLRTIAMPADLTGGYPYAIALSPNADLIALSYVPGGTDALLVWSGDRLLYRRDGETDFAVAFSPDGSTLATASRTRGVQLFRANDGVLITERILLLDTPRGL